MAAITNVIAGIRLVIAVDIVEDDKYKPSKYAFWLAVTLQINHIHISKSSQPLQTKKED